MLAAPLVTEHSHGIYQIDADYVEAGVACVYLIREGDDLAVIETGTIHTVPHILDTITAIGLSTENVRWIIPTHIHLDHAGGAGELMEQCPNAELVIHPRGAAHMIDPAKLEAGTMSVYGEERYRELYGELKPIPASRVVEAADNFTIDFNGRRFTFLDTPGHALHHFCVHDAGSNGIFSGDTFGLSYRQFDKNGSVLLFVTTTPTQFDPDAMNASIKRMADMNPEQIFLTHYGPVAASEENLEQLRNSLTAFVELAEAQLGSPENRKELLSQQILDWLLKQITDRGIDVDLGFARNWLNSDAKLNAQGLDVWLLRREKNLR